MESTRIETPQVAKPLQLQQPRIAKMREALRGIPVIPAIIMVLFLGCALLADNIAPYPVEKMSLGSRLAPPFFIEGGSTAHLFGTDSLGRDILSRMIVGARISLLVSLLAIIMGGSIGVTVGILAGYIGGKTEAVIMRIVDATLAFPMILIALLLAVSLGPSFMTVVLAIGMIIWAGYARMIRGEVLRIREAGFVAQAKIMGVSPLRMLWVHMLPNVVNILLVIVTLQVGSVILLEASLSFLGAGVPPPNPTWGSMVSDGRDLFNSAWWISLFPGIGISMVVLSGNFMGDWIRDRLDPRLRQT